MATTVELLGLLVVVSVNTAVAALATRFLRVRLHTRLGSAVYTATIVPVLLLVLTLVFGGVLRLGPDLGSAAAVVGLLVVLPLAVGVTVDFFWMPAPGEVDLPEASDGGSTRRRRSRR